MPGTCHQCLTQSKAVFSADLGSRLTLLFEVQVDPPLVTSLISLKHFREPYISQLAVSPLGLQPAWEIFSSPFLLEPDVGSRTALGLVGQPDLMARLFLSDPNQVDPTGEWQD
jgi:hypothetical protein